VPFKPAKLPSLLQAKEASDRGEKYTYTVTEQHITSAIGDLLKKKDLSKYIL
jgi:ATP-dependent protease HslVU (ClpYQ) ATPase subunit